MGTRTRMVTLSLAPSEATLAMVQEKFGLKPDQIDAAFGVVPLDPATHQYAILVNEEVAEALQGRSGVSGQFSNPQIEPFGPPKR